MQRKEGQSGRPEGGAKVNYYERHIGDYLKDTAHLSLLEHGIYTRLMDVYYTRESALPEDQVARLIGARSKEEKEALAAVLEEFFTKEVSSWKQTRCEAEIARYQDKQRKAKASADARWSHTERNANASTDAMRTHSEGNAPSNQTPDTSTKEAKASSSAAKLPTCPTQNLIDLYHLHLPELPAVRLMTDKRKKALGQFWVWVLTSQRTDGTPRATNAEEALRWIGEYFARAKQNDFLMGRTPRTGEHANWKPDLEFLLTDKGKTHVIEKT